MDTAIIEPSKGGGLVIYNDVTLSKLALASTMYDCLTPFNKSLALLNGDTGGSIDLSNHAHRTSLLIWLNDWGCRHLSEEHHKVASDSILKWYQAKGDDLFPENKPLWDLGDAELKMAASAYGSLKDKIGAWRDRGGRKVKVHIGPTAASKILFAIRPQALMPWDEAIRASYKFDGSAESYYRYLEEMRNFTLHIEDICKNKGLQIDGLPKELGRPGSTVLTLVNKYIWITRTKKCILPSAKTLARWAELG